MDNIYNTMIINKRPIKALLQLE